jgi:hypothetical protein
MDQVKFSQLEKILMEKAGAAESGHGGALSHLLVGTVAGALLVYSYLGGISSTVIFWVTLGYVILTTLQRVASSWAIAIHKLLVRKLVRHAADTGRKIQSDSPVD